MPLKQLVPSSLGRMELSIASNRGIVTVNLALDSVQAKQTVERNISQLENRLASSGIKVDNFHITVHQPNKNDAAGQQYHPYQQGNRSGNQQQNGYARQQFGKSLAQRFAGSDLNFDKVMVNCLA